MDKLYEIDNENDKNNKQQYKIKHKDDYFSEEEYSLLLKKYAVKSNIFDTITERKVFKIKKGDIIGKGAFGDVYQGFDEYYGEIVAVKEIELKKCNLRILESKLSSFEREINILSKLNHKNIVKYIGAVKTKDNCLQIILEYCIGGSIAKIVEQYKSLNESLIRKFTKQILEGLEYLHYNNIIHRDIKGGNILVDRNGVCKLTDFGGSKVIVEELESNNLDSFKGTPNWMAPETAKFHEHTRFSDIWSLGCTVYEMLTGNPPWSEIKDPFATLYHLIKTEIPPEIPDKYKSNISYDLHNFITSCLKINPKERPNVSQLLNHPFITNTNNSKKAFANEIKDTIVNTKGTLVLGFDTMDIANLGKEPKDKNEQKNLKNNIGNIYSSNNKVKEEKNKEVSSNDNNLELEITSKQNSVFNIVKKLGFSDINSIKINKELENPKNSLNYFPPDTQSPISLFDAKEKIC